MIAILLALLGLVQPAEVKGVQLLDPSIFGSGGAERVTLLLPRKAQEAEPSHVQVDIGCGKYYAATVTYRARVTCEEVRTSINALYGDHELTEYSSDESGLWRVVDEGFSISLGKWEETGACYIVYISSVLPDDIAKTAVGAAFGRNSRVLNQEMSDAWDAECAAQAGEGEHP